ncbi:MAG: hypothetical protein HYV14_04445 [Elusimicrobia bacterium]|nr:hypothetical protein [Elusimicrobiota bacterium]
MSLRLLAADGTLAAWAPASPPTVVLHVEGAGARARAVSAAARGALTFLGYEPAQGGGKPDLTVLLGPSTGGDFAYSEELHYLCLKTHPRKPLSVTREGLAAARGELLALKSSARALSGVTLEPSSRGVTGYLHRFREALSRDLDFPEALSCVWDGLRPGALSPGSKAALLRAALPALGIDAPFPG